MNINFGDVIEFTMSGQAYIGLVVSRLDDVLTVFTPATEDRGFTYQTSFVEAHKAHLIDRSVFTETTK